MRSPLSTPPKTRSSRKRQDIIKAASALFTERGYEATNMDDIAQLGDVSKRTVYKHFETKEALFEHVLQALWQQLGESIALTYEPSRGVREQLREVAQLKLALAADPKFIGLCRAASARFLADPELAERMNTHLQHKEDSLREWLRAAHADGALLIPDIERATEQFWALLASEGFWAPLVGLPAPSQHKRSRIIEGAVDLFLSHYGCST